MNGRIYDPINGVTCHQCRQKTIDEKSVCALNPTHNFCEKCLRNRYGEELSVIKKDPTWICPRCKNLCNCSICRKKSGKPPIGVFQAKKAKIEE